MRFAFTDEQLAFRDAVRESLATWGDVLAGAIADGQRDGSIRTGIDPKQTARFVLAAWEGTLISLRAERSSVAFDDFFDVVLCDLRMPGLDGPAFYDLLRRQHAYLRQRVIFLTGDTLGAASTAFLEQCGQPWVYKPCTAAAIRRALQQILRAPV